MPITAPEPHAASTIKSPLPEGRFPTTRIPEDRPLVRYLRILCALIMLCLCSNPAPVLAEDELMEAGRATTIDYILERAVSQGLIGGGVVVVGNHEGTLYTVSRGKVGFSADSPSLTERTIFDLAPLHPIVAPAPAIMKLLDDLLAAFVAQRRMKLPGTTYRPVYKLVA